MPNNIRSIYLPDEVPPQFVSLWQTSDEVWGFKDHNCRYVYANAPFFDLLNLDPEFNITGLLDSDLFDSKSKKTSFAKFALEFRKQEKLAKKTEKRVCSIDTYCFGREKKIQSYLFDKFPLWNSEKKYIGIMFHGRKMDFLTCCQYFDRTLPITLLSEKPDDFFTDQEFDVIFYLLQGNNNKVIAQKLSTSEQEITDYRQAIYQKANVDSLDDLEEFCKKNNYNRYVPQRFFKPCSIIIPLTAWNLGETKRKTA